MIEGASKQAKPKYRPCKVCSTRFQKRSMAHVCCSPRCAQDYAERKRIKAQQAAERKETAERKEKLKTRSDWLKEAQAEFNAYIRTRDMLAGHSCISSGRRLDWNGNAVDAGHYRSTGSAPHLRFDERNCHAQSKHDNRYLAGNAVDYRIGLIARIGLEAVEALEADQTPRKWSIDELKAIRDHYRAKRKALLAEQAERPPTIPHDAPRCKETA